MAFGASGEQTFSGLKVWNFTASACAFTATSTSSRAICMLPLWLTPASAMTKHGSPTPTFRPPIEILFALHSVIRTFQIVGRLPFYLDDHSNIDLKLTN